MGVGGGVGGRGRDHSGHEKLLAMISVLVFQLIYRFTYVKSYQIAMCQVSKRGEACFKSFSVVFRFLSQLEILAFAVHLSPQIV